MNGLKLQESWDSLIARKLYVCVCENQYNLDDAILTHFW